jgi:probable HAF family extracellular repeat protein
MILRSKVLAIVPPEVARLQGARSGYEVFLSRDVLKFLKNTLLNVEEPETMTAHAVPQQGGVVFEKFLAAFLRALGFAHESFYGASARSAWKRRVASTTAALGIALSLGSPFGCEAQGPKVDQIDFPEAQIKVVPADMFRHNTELDGINDSGTVVGSLFTAVTPKGTGITIVNWQAFLYKGGKFTLIEGPLPTHDPTHGVAINNRGQFLIRQDAGDGPHYFLYEPGGTSFRPMGRVGKLAVGGPPSFGLTKITGINDKGQIAGFVQGVAGVKGMPALGVPGALAAPPSGGVFTMVGCSGKAIMITGGINNYGEVAGSCDGGNSAFIAKRDGTTATFVPPAPRWLFNNGMGINDAGDVVGYSNMNSRETGFLYRKGQLTQLPNLGAYGINNHGQAVGVMQEGRLHFSGFLAQMQP